MTRLEEVQYLRTEPDGRHYNCAQSLLVPFASEVGLTKEQADALGANFGAGMKMGSTCGVLTSALMLLGMKGCTPQQAAQLVQRFREKHQDTNCAALLSKAKEEGMPILAEVYNGEVIPSRAFAEGGIHEAIMAYEDVTFFEILAEELALRDLDADRATAENYDEVMERMEEYMGEFEAHGTDHINVDLE